MSDDDSHDWRVALCSINRLEPPCSDVIEVKFDPLKSSGIEFVTDHNSLDVSYDANVYEVSKLTDAVISHDSRWIN